MFRKRQTAAAVEEDPIPEDLLASIPELDSADASATEETPAPAFVPVLQAQEEPAQAPVTPADWQPQRWNPPPSNAGPAPAEGGDAYALLAEVRKQMEASFAREIGKAEDSFTTVLKQMEARLQRANAELNTLRAENEQLLRVKADYDRKVAVLNELKKNMERL